MPEVGLNCVDRVVLWGGLKDLMQVKNEGVCDD